MNTNNPDHLRVVELFQASGVKVMILETDMIEAQAVINTARTATDHD